MLTNQEKKARGMLCLALDGLENFQDIKDTVKELSSEVGLFKVGKESFTRFGPKVIDFIHQSGSEVFLDLKYHDIPHTVKEAAKAASELGVYMFNLHALGGREMMLAAKEGVEEMAIKKGLRKPKIIAVTILTSIDKKIMNEDLGISGEVSDRVLQLATMAANVGLDGVVCSATDLQAIKPHLAKDFIYVTPGIKGVNSQAGSDQKRVFSPANAVEAGSTILVVGRAIMTADNRLKATQEILADMARKL
ncbi:MAG TPA: orotidine-5'-phosphate decarboxylase [Candidatus Woesebacteria bacterium]|nr:orotidine-5'-phosphate decarboxylase [Candidatus Woesebacteria bacterium]HPA62232.1 orotidine-5'-phosphate decarboxylase [Candidatus Woesebacteria bacterium]HQL11168.1 orotidine-5'-phosphate decarboxylase [Candidatus Woesebacteria bacterium]HQO51807.1 orotidine-5'-phosphate decarboxylase [Candidatus Woesebacteria bacterium]HUM57121.1 orotidine-5'-phosphate decarboxylase [Candidatus Woesebacteria bacterium]